MKDSGRNDFSKATNLGLFSISLIPVVFFFFIVVQRIGLPFDLEWGEGAGFNQIYHIMSGGRLYGPPSIDFTPLVYTPLYYWLSATISRIMPSAVLGARLLSVLASVGSVILIALLVRKETGNSFAGWLAGTIYLACFSLSDGFYDLVRVDSLYAFLLIASFLTLLISNKTIGMIAGGLLITLGFFTKQSALIVFLPYIIYLLCRNWKKAWPLLPTIVLGIILPIYLINARSDGWFTYYIFKLPQEHGYSLVSAVNFWIGDLLGPVGIAFCFGILYFYTKLSENSNQGKISTRTDQQHRHLDYLLFAVGAIGGAWITRASNGGGANNVMSAYAVVALLFGFGFSALENQIKNGSSRRNAYQILFYSLVVIQQIGLIYNPFNFIPSGLDIDLNQQLVEEIEEATGPIWIPYRSHLPLLGGKDFSIHAVNLFELTGYFKGDILPEGTDLVDQIQEEICRQTYGMIVLDQPIPWIEEQLTRAYVLNDSLFDTGTGRRSPQLSWQGGFDAIYIPQELYDLEGCLDTIYQKGEG